MTSPSCRSRIFPDVAYLPNTYYAQRSISNNIPNCIFELPHLQTLHLSGNGIKHDLLNTDSIVITTSLQDLSLSNNNFIGSIPIQIQNKNWRKIDLSSNKFNGILKSSIDLSNSSVKFDINRLSGKIPDSMHDTKQINILTGNLFSW